MKRYESMTKEEIIGAVKSCCIGDILGSNICAIVSFQECMERAHNCGLCAIDYLNEEVKETENEKNRQNDKRRTL